MKCVICDSNTEYFLSKKYEQKPFDSFMQDIGEVEYCKCENCGFTFSRTHFELNEKQWEKLNFDFHNYLENNVEENKINQPPYLEQATLIKILSENGIIDSSDMLDFAGGHGTLSNILDKYFDIFLPVFDPYVQKNERSIYIDRGNLKKYKTVINSALFEHVTSLESLEEINNCVSTDGCLVIHTVICENIPKDNNWFYFVPPVHCAFHTNKSMDILMKKWGYKSSIYCPKSKSWVLLKKEVSEIDFKIKLINKEFQTDYLICKTGFVDYWKGF